MQKDKNITQYLFSNERKYTNDVKKEEKPIPIETVIGTKKKGGEKNAFDREGIRRTKTSEKVRIPGGGNEANRSFSQVDSGGIKAEG